MELTTILIVQLTVLLFIYVLSRRILEKKEIIIDGFNYVTWAWVFNTLYVAFSLVQLVINKDFDNYNKISTTINFLTTALDLTSMYLFLLGIWDIAYPYLKKIYLTSRRRVAIFFFICGVFKLTQIYPSADLISFINVRNIPVAIIDSFVLFCLAKYFRRLIIEYNLLNVSSVIKIYSFIQFLSILQEDSFMGDSIVIYYNITYIGFLIGLLCKITIFISLLYLLTNGYEYYNKKMISENLDLIIGRTFHEITPQLHDIEKSSKTLKNHKSENVIIEAENLLSCTSRIRTILEASAIMYKNDITQLDNQYHSLSFGELKSRWIIYNINTLIYSSIMNFKGRILYEHTNNNYVTKDFDVHCEYSSDCQILCNPVEIIQIFYNLLKNSFEAAAEAGVPCNIFIKTRNISLVVDELSKKMIVIDFEDDGPGIKPEDIDKIFNAGFTTKNTTLNSGSGLGLFIIHDILQKYNGEINVESPIQEPSNKNNKYGTKFQLRFPKT